MGGRSVGEKSSGENQGNFLPTGRKGVGGPESEMRRERFLDEAVKGRQGVLAGPRKAWLETVTVLTKSLGFMSCLRVFQSLHDQPGQRKRE